jgi:hypothetical protein
MALLEFLPAAAVAGIVASELVHGVAIGSFPESRSSTVNASSASKHFTAIL